jgi:hypothetical protein
LSRSLSFAHTLACGENPERSAMLHRERAGSAGSVFSVNTFCPSRGPVAIRYVIE